MERPVKGSSLRDSREPELGNLNDSGFAHGKSKVQDQPKNSPQQNLQNILDKFPKILKGPLCWTSETFPPGSTDYVVSLSDGEHDSILNAAQGFKERKLNVEFIDTTNFVLPDKLHNKLRGISDVIHNGVGFAVLRGLRIREFKDIDHAIVFCGIASHVAPERETNELGKSMVHIRDASNEARPAEVYSDHLHPSKLSGRMNFHCDRMYGDIIAMYVRSKSASGGEQYLASFWTIYNRLMAENSEHLKALATDFSWLPRERAHPGDIQHMPAMMQVSGRVITQFVWATLHGRPELVTTPQLKALNAVEKTANEVCIKLDIKEGDIQFINNFALLHARAGFKDSQTQKRHIMRLGLRDPAYAWDTPVEFANAFALPMSYPPEEQQIPVTDFDPWYGTTTTYLNHG